MYADMDRKYFAGMNDASVLGDTENRKSSILESCPRRAMWVWHRGPSAPRRL